MAFGFVDGKRIGSNFERSPVIGRSVFAPSFRCSLIACRGPFWKRRSIHLAWHYRRADPDEANLRAKELLDDLAGYTRNIDVQVLEGNKVLEVRNTGVSKGTASIEWLDDQEPDFILAIGDDWTDEDLFKALPPSAYSVRVGLANTAARYYLTSHLAVRRLLKEFEIGKPPQGAQDGLIVNNDELAA